MTLIELARLIQTMRQSQKKYFRTRTGVDLAMSKFHEALVDAKIAKILDPPSLFPEASKDDQTS